MSAYRNHEWGIMELPTPTSPAAREFLGDKKRTVRICIVPEMYPDAPTLGMESSYNAFVINSPKVKQPSITDLIVEYLLKNGPSTVAVLVEAVNRSKSNVFASLRNHTECFEKSGAVTETGGDIWRLKRGVA